MILPSDTSFTSSPGKVPDEGKTVARRPPACPQFNTGIMNQNKRVAQIEGLARDKGPHYNVFKSNSTLLALFDACKGFEEESLMAHSTRMSMIDESTIGEPLGGATEILEEESKQDESIVMIRPLDPALMNVRYLPPKTFDSP